ncbi:MAG: hypothetical protein KJO69_06435 [Gammaproteobacteria bacterium]|nr:hypothetical protein [Gammaproteobacteria bacterium]
MSIKISNTTTKPEVVYDRFFLQNLSLEQTATTDNSAPPKYRLQVLYRIYGIDADGQRHYQPKVQSITIDNYYAAAMAKAQVGDMDLVSAMMAIEAALANIIEDQTDLGSAQVIS